MKRLHYKKKHVDVAENWGELSAHQFIKLAGLLHSDIADDPKLVEAFRIISGKGMFLFLMMNKDFIYRSLEHVQWVFEKQLITKQLIYFYKGYCGPESDFDNLTLQEFHCCEIAYHECINKNDEQSLNKLVAFLYRKRKEQYDDKINKDGDVRCAFNYNECIFHLQHINQWPLNLKQAILLWYDGCRQMLVKAYPLAFGGKSKNDNYYEGLYGMIRSLAGDKYGKFEEVERMYVHNAFMEIVACKREEIELEKQMARQ